MSRPAMGAALRVHLGDEASGALMNYVEMSGEEWKNDVRSTLVTREHLDQQLHLTRDHLDQQLRLAREHLDEQIRDRLVTRDHLEVRLQTLVTKEEFFRGISDLRKEMSTQRVELLRWSFLFWIGQVATTAGLISFSLHFAR